MTTCVVAHPDALFRSAVGPLLEEQVDMALLGGVGDASVVADAVAQHAPDLLLLDADLHGDGLAACRALRAAGAAVRILVLGADDGGLVEAMEAGADGFIERTMPLDDVWRAFDQVAQGQAYVPPGMLAPLLRRLIDSNREADRALGLVMALTRREREILELLVDGCDQQTVAEILVISSQTARTHIQNVLGKLEVHSKLEAVALVAQHGLLERIRSRDS